MRLTLLFTLTLFLAACSDNSTNDSSTASNALKKEAVVEQKETIVEQKEAVVRMEPAEEAIAPEPVQDKPAIAEKEEEAISGHVIFVRKCASCHGQNGEKSALNKSQVIAGWDKKKSAEALKGYQNDSYGSSLKGIMKAQANSLSDEQIEAVTEYISTLSSL